MCSANRENTAGICPAKMLRNARDGQEKVTSRANRKRKTEVQPCRREIRVSRGGGAKQVPQGEQQNSSAQLDCACTEDEGALRLLDAELLGFSGTPDSLVSPTWLQPWKMSCAGVKCQREGVRAGGR